MSISELRQKQDRQLRPRVVARAKQVYAGDVTPFDLECIVPVLRDALVADGEQARRDAFSDDLIEHDSNGEA